MKITKKSLATIAVSTFALIAFSACDGDAENAGEKIDDAAEEAADGVDEAADEVGDAIEDATE